MKNIDSINNQNPKQPLPPRMNVNSGPQGPEHINLLSRQQSTKPRRWLKFFIMLIVAGAILTSGLILAKTINLSSKIFVGQKTSFFEKVRQFIRGSDGSTPLIGENLGQINVLLLGIGGEGHDGPYLSDTMILAQIRPDTSEVTLTSIPRDYLVNLPGNQGQQKINAAFALGMGKDKNWNKAGEWSRQVVEKMSGLTIPYFAVIDFSGFEKAVNEVGGLDVTIDRTFTDYQYPDSGIGYLPPQTFTAGPAHMDGSRALIFARSRHAAGIEGSDFSRSQRQQKIIQAFKSRALAMNIISDAGKINSLLNVFADHFHTNINPGELFRIYTIIKDHNIQKFLSLSLDPETGLICPEILESNGAYVLVPCKSEVYVQNFFKNSFSIGKIADEKAVVWLASSTGNRQAYNTAFRTLTNAGLTVYELTYGKDNLPESLVYQVNPKPATAEFISNELKAQTATLPPPGVHVPENKVDVIVILGQNALVQPEPAPYIAPPARKPTTTTSTPETTPTSTPATSTPKNITLPH